MRLSPVVAAALLLCLPLSACGSIDADRAGRPGGGRAPAAEGVDQGAYVNVVKLTGIAWFDRMKIGVEDFGTTSGRKVTQAGPATDSPEQQASLIQGLIAQRPAGMGIIPSDPQAVDAVVKQARGAGIRVVTHEAPQLTSPDADVEAFDNADYGRKILTGLAACMKGEGQYVQFVGKLTATSHMAWAKAVADEQRSAFPAMERLGEPVESMDSAEVAYVKAKHLLQTHPRLKGFSGASSQDVVGIARAVSEAGLNHETCVHGTGVPSETKHFLADGAIDAIYFWDPARAGKAVMKATQLLAEGKKLSDGEDLGVEGYRRLRQSKDNPLVFLGDAALSATKDDVMKYDF
ncbi:monosaccharide ABC transporter substrate-binding protein, CUT2 family [Austwickia chelonae]|uniref:Putative ABC transporter substrate-binding protein n=1 Tax=Austwickia chelonae NBRC 105200 TaxID=1184607 RepID=K6UL13_9MICO|nr:autoinducer 2 ABC transporter substrate-binding protein [Austwickia chelonae]GAB76851.1 putative ABC transporter substrate-binding protein [Austwickia chelonae NBRC 105200]SEW31557.1 monosaccharide ABC transporter substrate-binding protein, CUT2 family [Austwickia chelonae]